MSKNRELHKKLRSTRALFYPADFHIHSPASADIRHPSRFNDLSEETRSRLVNIPETTANNPVEYELQVIDAFPPSSFFDSLVNRRDEIVAGTDGEDGDNWAIIAITDHNVCKYAYQVSTHAWTLRSSNRLIVLPGIELTVSYPVSSDNTKASAHLLCIFSPQTSDSDVRMAISKAAEENWTFGESLDIKSLPHFVNNIRHHCDYPAICIAAHVGSDEGVQNETRNAILSRLDAAISRVMGELQDGDHPDKDALCERLDQLKRERNETDQIALEILDLIGRCGFDALQVRGKKDEIHYRRLHRFREQMGRAVPIVCSDSHRVEDVFITEWGVPHLKLSGLSPTIPSIQLFNSIRNALRLGETRFTYILPEAPLYWISGLEVSPDAISATSFWPFAICDDGESKSFVLPLSRNFNCLVGGRGSGKSAALEALAFVVKESDFNGFYGKRIDQIDDYYSRAKATVSGCNLKICWQFVKHDKAKNLPKRAVFSSRYFDPSDHHPNTTFYSADDTELLADQIPDCSIQYYRLGEIEQQAGAERLRILFDQICGRQIQEHDQRIEALIEQLQEQRTQIVEVSGKISELTQDDSSLRQYVLRKRLYDEINTNEIKKAYEEVDRSTAAETHVESTINNWENIRVAYPMDMFAELTNGFFNDLKEESTDEQNQPKPYQDQLVKLSSEASDPEEAKTLRTRVTDSINLLDTELNSVEEALKGKRIINPTV